jgi:dUTP pyrophosphatase
LAIDFPIKLLSDRATLPTLGSDFAAGLDLYAAEEKTIPARGKALVDLQLSVAVPKGHYGRIAPRSGLGELQVELGAWKMVVHFRLER